MTREITLKINDEIILIDYFVQSFIDHSVYGMLSSLKGIGEIKSGEISINSEVVKVNVNQSEVNLNPFVEKIFKSTLEGMVSSLKGVTKINKIYLMVKR